MITRSSSGEFFLEQFILLKNEIDIYVESKPGIKPAWVRFKHHLNQYDTALQLYTELSEKLASTSH